MTTPATRSTLLASVTLLVLLAPALVQAAEPGRQRFALELNAASSGSGEPREAASVTRRIASHLVPRLENAGYIVHRVRNAKKAMRTGKYDASLRVDMDAKPLYIVHSALQYEKSVVTEHDTGASAWGQFWYYQRDRRQLFVDKGKIGPFQSQLHQSGGIGRPILDDEDAVARTVVSHVLGVTIDAPWNQGR